ncbi:MAG TPA: hypothetical protein VGJ84_14645, partial [Polyangiaceae bacterium]
VCSLSRLPRLAAAAGTRSRPGSLPAWSTPDISAGQGAVGVFPQAVIDATNRKLLVVTDNGANDDKPALFSVCLD